jgi:hypothetical protein
MRNREVPVLENLPIALGGRPDATEIVASLPTGIDPLDKLLGGGLPRERIIEIVGPPTSGRTGVILSILAQAVAKGEIVAYIDTFDSLDPCFANKAGVKLKRLLWVRCEASQEKAFKAADILAPTGRFGVLVLDLSPAGNPFQQGRIRKAPLSSWFRLQRSLQGTSTLLLVIGQESTAGSAAAIAMSLRRCKVQWCFAPSQDLPPSLASLTPFLYGIWTKAHLLRGKHHGHVTFYSRL